MYINLRLHNLLDQLGVAHAGNTTLGANVRRDTFKCHDRHCTGLFGNSSLLGIDDAGVRALFHRCNM